MGYARPRADQQLTWEELKIRDLRGKKMKFTDAWGKEHSWVPESEWVHSYFFCSDTGLYVLSDDEDVAFTAHSIDLEFAEEIPNGQG